MPVLISNAVDSSYEKCEGGCVSWLVHWENHVDEYAEICSVVDCEEEEDLVGAHVYIEEEGYEDDDCYIIPLCRHHNHSSYDYLHVRRSTIFVPVSELETCTDEFEYED